MAKNNKDGDKKSTAKKPAAKAVVKEETPIEEPQVDNGTVKEEDIPVGPGNPEGTNEGSGEVPEEAPAVEETVPEETPAEETPAEEVQEEETPEASLPPEDNSPKEEDVPTMPEPVAPPVDYRKIEAKPESNWRDRVLTEARELKIKMDALKAALDGHKVPASEVVILNEQYTAMQAYYLILNKRLS